ncbi:MAG: hypothetical protein QXN87_08525 [Candidatus Bathyarchaeia archaeon]
MKVAGEAEEALGSRGRIKVLEAFLAAQRRGHPVSMSKLKVATGLKNVERHVAVLLKHGWVEVVQTPEGRRYRLMACGKVEALKRLFMELSRPQAKRITSRTT